MLQHLYERQRMRVRTEGTQDIKLERGIRQGCSMSPALFGIHADTLFEEALDKLDGVEVGRKK